MGSKSSKWLAAALAATALAVVPAGAVAKLDYSRNSVSGQYLPSPAGIVPQINDVSTPSPGAAVPVRIAAPSVPSVKADSGFSVADALAGAGAALLIAFGGMAIVRRRRPSLLAG